MILCDLQPVFSYILTACVQIIGLYLRLAGSSLALAFCFLHQVSAPLPDLEINQLEMKLLTAFIFHHLVNEPL